MKFYGYWSHWKWCIRLLAPFWAYLDWKRGENRYMDCLKMALFFPKSVGRFHKHKAGYNPKTDLEKIIGQCISTPKDQKNGDFTFNTMKFIKIIESQGRRD